MSKFISLIRGKYLIIWYTTLDYSEDKNALINEIQINFFLLRIELNRNV